MSLFLAFVVALAVTAVCIQLLLRWAPAIGLTDRPGPRKIHSVPLPRVGGIAMAAGILVSVLLIVPWTPALAGLVAGLVVLLIFGVWDDRSDLDYRLKFAGQVLAVILCMAIGGVRIDSLTIANRLPLPDAVSWMLTFVFLVGVTNAVNLSDGLDGLAGGLALLCLCAIAVLAAVAGNPAVTTIALIESGAILGFLRFNTHPARVFMGDSGSQVIGFTIGVLSILATQGEGNAVSAALPLLLLGLPILDTLTVMMQRIGAGRSPFSSDRNHFHHKLLSLGFSHAEAVALAYLVQVGLFLLAYFLRFESDLTIVEVFVAFALTVLLVLHFALRSHWQAHRGGRAAVAGGIRRRWRALRRSNAAQRCTLWVMGAGLGIYAVTVIVATSHIGRDVTLLSTGLLLILVLGASRPSGTASWLERAAAYVSVILLVYLDETVSARSLDFVMLSWTIVAVTGAAGLLRFLLATTRRFELTALDMLVAFIALVIPNLPGSLQLPADLPAGIAKTVVLLYVVELLLGVAFKRSLPRACLLMVLSAVAVRGVFVLIP